jgi:hypothetical protein
MALLNQRSKLTKYWCAANYNLLPGQVVTEAYIWAVRFWSGNLKTTKIRVSAGKRVSCHLIRGSTGLPACGIHSIFVPICSRFSYNHCFLQALINSILQLLVHKKTRFYGDNTLSPPMTIFFTGGPQNRFFLSCKW